MRNKNNNMLKKRIPLIMLSLTFLPCSFTSFSMEPAKPYEQQNTEEIAKTLQNLTQYEIDWSFLVSQCLENVNNQALKDKLVKVKEECEDHIRGRFQTLLENTEEKLLPIVGILRDSLCKVMRL
jgi:hypothetical protein